MQKEKLEVQESLKGSHLKMVKLGIGILIAIILLGCTFAFGINAYVKYSTKKYIISNRDYQKIGKVDCVIVLGAGIWGDEPSPMLKDRIMTAVELYQEGVVSKIIMSGDHGRENYDEVKVMKRYAIENGVPSEDIFMDHAGFSTYESIYRAKEIFQAKKVIIVTQEYHLYRALYIASHLGLEAYGMPADKRSYSGQTYRELREILARNKDFIQCIFQPKPKYLGDIIPVSGDGNITNDEENEFSE